jgi:hypothetical protein
MTHTDPWPIDRTHTAPSVPPPNGPWWKVIREADDVDLHGYGDADGVARVGASVYFRHDGLTTRSDHRSEWDAIDAYLTACALHPLAA